MISVCLLMECKAYPRKRQVSLICPATAEIPVRGTAVEDFDEWYKDD